MRIGTKSVIYGFHAFWIHPWFVARAWWILFGFPSDLRLWVAFFVHDLGYIGKPNMDGEEGETHPVLGAQIMRRLFGQEWSDLCLLHSRFYCKRLGRPVSPLGIADKYAICLTPCWLWKLQVCATGEIKEYLETAKYREDMAGWREEDGRNLDHKYDAMTDFLLGWVRQQMVEFRQPQR